MVVTLTVVTRIYDPPTFPPISGARVTIDRNMTSEVIQFTDQEGVANFIIEAGTHSYLVEKTGYYTVDTTITYPDGATPIAVFEMTPITPSPVSPLWLLLLLLGGILIASTRRNR